MLQEIGKEVSSPDGVKHVRDAGRAHDPWIGSRCMSYSVALRRVRWSLAVLLLLLLLAAVLSLSLCGGVGRWQRPERGLVVVRCRGRLRRGLLASEQALHIELHEWRRV